MSDMNNNNALILEGIYKGLSAKVDDVKESVLKELQFNSAQSGSTTEAILAAIREQLEPVLLEIQYLEQQISAVNEKNVGDLQALQTAITETLGKKIDERIDALREELLAEDNAPASVPAEFDYDTLAEKIAAVLPEPDTDAIAEKVVAGIPAADEAAIADRVTEAVDYELIANRVVEILEQRWTIEEVEDTEEPEEEPAPEEESEEVVEETETEEEPVAEEVPVAAPAEPFDYEFVANRVVELLKGQGLLVAVVDEAPVAEVPATAAAPAEPFDCDGVATRVVEMLKEEGLVAAQAETEPAEPFDYDRAATRVVEMLKEEGLLVAAQAETEPAEEPAEELAEPEPVEEPVEEPAEPEPVEEPVEEPAEPEPVEEPVEEPAEEPAEEPTVDELAVAEAEVVETPADEPEVAEADEPSPEMTTRLKRSFTAKIIESEETVKQYYSDLKNALLAYPQMASQINWSNDRFAFNNETVAKIGVRGKTLCLYLALDPEEFPESVYHQKFAGNTKMYERTPLMMKVKSNVALKRSIRLIELLAERLGVVKEEIEPVDYVSMYAFRSEEELLKEGLIKTGLMEKSDLNF